MRNDGVERPRRARASVAGAAMLAWLCAGGAGARLPAAGPAARTGAALPAAEVVAARTGAALPAAEVVAARTGAALPAAEVVAARTEAEQAVRPGAGWARETAATQSGGTVADGVFTAEQVSRGEQTFRDVCSACHDTVEFSGGRFRFTWVGLTAADLFDTIATLMPEGDPGSLSPAQYAAVVAYLLDLNGYPAGETPLPTDLPALRALEIVAAP